MFGDPKQGLGHGDGSETHYSFPVVAKSNICHRLPKSGVDFLNKCTGGNAKYGANTEEGTIDKGEINDGIPDDATVLALTPESRDILSEDIDDVVLVSEIQGSEWDVVVLYIFHHDLDAMRDPDLLTVALTRWKKTLCIRFEDMELFSKLVNRMVSNCCKHQATTKI